jgi:hypothetical protein
MELAAATEIVYDRYRRERLDDAPEPRALSHAKFPRNARIFPGGQNWIRRAFRSGFLFAGNVPHALLPLMNTPGVKLEFADNGGFAQALINRLRISERIRIFWPGRYYL